jgi:hypothetical protein
VLFRSHLAEGAPGRVQDKQCVLVARTARQLLDSGLVQGSHGRGLTPEVTLSLALLAGAISLLDVAAVQAALLGCGAVA